MSKRSEFIAGVRAELPIVVGVVPFGLIFGVLAANFQMNPWLAWSMSSIIFAGSAQFLTLPLIAAGTPAVILILTTFIINLRHMLYSASLAPAAAPLSRGWKGLLAYLLTDEAYIPTAQHYADASVPTTFKHWYWLGTGLTLWATWQISTGVGIFLGAQIPTDLGLEFTLALTFIGMITPSLTNRPMIGAAVSAGLVAMLTKSLPYNLGLMAAALAGIATGLLLEQVSFGRPLVKQRQEV